MPEVTSSPYQEPRLANDPLRGRVLFMDDEANIRRMVEALLEHIGMEVVAVEDGETTVEHYRAGLGTKSAFDLVVVDLTVPGGMGGRETLTALQEIDPAVRVVVSSGYSVDPVLANYAEHGFCGRVTKPYRAADLIRVLRSVLAHEPSAAAREA